MTWHYAAVLVDVGFHFFAAIVHYYSLMVEMVEVQRMLILHSQVMVLVMMGSLVSSVVQLVGLAHCVVADSVGETEYEETVNKAKAIFRAADEAVRFASRSSGNR